MESFKLAESPIFQPSERFVNFIRHMHRGAASGYLRCDRELIGMLSIGLFRISVELSTHEQNGVTAVTERKLVIGETPIVDMVRRAAVKKTLLELGDTRQQWKGEAAACFVLCRDHQ